VLLLAQSLPNGKDPLRHALRVLRLRQPIVTIFCEAEGFEEGFLDLLKRGMVLPGAVARCNGYEHSRSGPFQFDRMLNAKWRIVSFAGFERDRDITESRIGDAARSVFPILAVAERIERFPSKFVQAAQLNLVCGRLNAAIVLRTIKTVLGEAPADRLDGIDFIRLELADLAIAIRPGVTPGAAVENLRKLASTANHKSSNDGSTGSQAAAAESGKSGSSNSSTRRSPDAGSGSDVIEPVEISASLDGKPIPTIETLAGYGQGRDWALQLSEDLPVWRAGTLSWHEMCTKILLSGPPGTGKTLFAQALCNTLQLPLLATSVARWLEPSYLGEVLKRMRRAFREAEVRGPSILFIDEFDGIGRRVDFSRDDADYWNSFVNCGLELLDGAKRTSGVIVVCATNNPSVIDPALLRSGRIERHIEIPLPDTEARIAILRHHLGNDLDAVIASAHQVTDPGKRCEAELRKVLGEVPDDVLRRIAASSIPIVAKKGKKS
jgi:hypothetical protein